MTITKEEAQVLLYEALSGSNTRLLSASADLARAFIASEEALEKAHADWQAEVATIRAAWADDQAELEAEHDIS